MIEAATLVFVWLLPTTVVGLLVWKAVKARSDV